jgi:hypothetical protein
MPHRSIRMTTTNSPKSNTEAIKASVFRTMRVLPALGILPLAAQAGLFQSDEQDRVDELCSLQKPVNDLLDQLKPRMIPNAVGVYAMTTELKGGKEDSNAVRVYMEVSLQFLQAHLLWLEINAYCICNKHAGLHQAHSKEDGRFG